MCTRSLNTVTTLGQRHRVHIKATTTHRPNVGPMFALRPRRQPNIGPALGRCVVYAGICMAYIFYGFKLCLPIGL